MRKRIALIAVLTALVLPAVAAATPAHATYGQTVHVVQPGDTLYSIARYYGVSPAALAKANDVMNPNFIWIGQSLVVPGSSMPVHDYHGKPPSGGSYVVQPGDTLFSIAAHFGTTVSALAAANDLGNENVIFIGQTLTIPGHGMPSYGYSPEPAYYSPKQCGYYYTVSYGDTLTDIAARHGTSVYAVAAANGLSFPYMVYAGQALHIPCDVGYYAPVNYHPKPYAHPPHKPAPKPHHGPKPTPKPSLSPAACAREVQIVRPLQGQHVSGVVQVIGTAVIDDFQFYKVEFAPGHTPLDSAFASIGDVHTTPASDTVLATWYVGNLASGPYTLRLTAVDQEGQWVRPCNVQVHVN